MPSKAKELSALEIGRLSEPGYHFAGGVAGLILQILPTGGKTWILRTMVAGKRRDIGLGGYPSVTLAGAREAARIAREKIRAGTDPVEDRKQQRASLAAKRASAITFKDAAEQYIAAHEKGWKNKKHGAQWSATLSTYAYPTLGKLLVSDVGTAHIMKVLEPIWAGKTETASRVRGRIESILGWATVRGYRKGDNPARWRGHIDALLPERRKVQKVKHHAALPYARIGQFNTSLASNKSIVAQALRFAILTAARSGEVRGAVWTEIDLDKAIWTIPAARMKADKEHAIPLPKEVISLLKSLPRIAECDLVFPNAKQKAISDMAFTTLIRRMDAASIEQQESGWRDANGEVITAHGFRSTFRDWAGETTAYPREVIEHALAHQLKDKAEAAYQRGTLFEKRRRLMADWAKYSGTAVEVAGVMPIRGAA